MSDPHKKYPAHVTLDEDMRTMSLMLSLGWEREKEYIFEISFKRILLVFVILVVYNSAQFE